jgi:predicted O-methyltransferase YrrM
VARLLARLRRRKAGRTLPFRGEAHDRFWWHKLDATAYDPPPYAALTGAEWRLFQDWYRVTQADGRIGEINVPAISLVHGLVGGNGLRRIAQLGHYCGYSTLLLGFQLRAMDARPGLVSFDIDAGATEFTRAWVERAGLEEWVDVRVGDSADPASAAAAEERLGGPLELLLVDSSHQYEHTLRELDLWAPRIAPGGLMLLHGAGEFADEFDATGQGGVRRALAEWLPRNPGWSSVTINPAVARGGSGNELAYKDACGLALVQRAT